jgi:alkylation response protein AidB-like acyl-CoA dehydrogenase
VQRGDQVQFDDPGVEPRRRGGGLGRRRAARVADHHVHAAEQVPPGRDQLPNLFRVPDVRAGERGRPAARGRPTGAVGGLGEENRGWPLITNQLNHERVALTSAAPVIAALADVRNWAASVRQADGRRVIDAEWVQLNLARVHAKAEFLKLLNWRVASAGGVLGRADASATKVFGTEFAVEAYRLLMEVLGARGVVRSGSPGDALAGRIERAHRAALILTFGGGTNEVQRDIIAAAALGLPLSRR